MIDVHVQGGGLIIGVQMHFQRTASCDLLGALLVASMQTSACAV